MKKGTSFLLVFTAFLGITLSSCKMKLEDDNLMDKPGVSVTQSQITVIIPKTSKDTSYVNVYRRDKDDDKVVSIGVLYHPYALINDEKNYCYIDTLVKKEHSYDYKVRYKTKGEYYYSEWSDPIYIESTYDAYDSDKKLAYQANGANFIYNDDDYTLEFNGSVADPEITDISDFDPMLIVTNGSSTQAFSITSIGNHDKIPLRSTLPRNFMDTPISVLGIVAQKTNKVGNEIQSIIWTELTSLTVSGAGADQKFTVPLQTGVDGFDYRSANSSSPKMTIEQ